MSPEWMVALDAAATRHDVHKRTLADPLERPEWQGLGFMSRLFARWLRGRTKGRWPHRTIGRRRFRLPASINEFNGSVR